MHAFTSRRSIRGTGHPRLAVVLLVLAALGFGGWGLWRAYGPQPANAGERLREATSRIDALEQEVATLKRSDQISRQANADLQGTLAVNMDFSGHQPQPKISFQPSVSITRADAAVPMPAPATTPARSVDGSGLANVSGVVQSVQVAGDGNLADNVVRLNVHDGGATPAVADGPSQGSTTTRQDGASASAGFDGKNASVQLDVNGLGSVQQWIRNGSLGQSVQLASDNQAVSNLMEIDLVRQSLATNMQLTQNVAQAISLARGIGSP